MTGASTPLRSRRQPTFHANHPSTGSVTRRYFLVAAGWFFVASALPCLAQPRPESGVLTVVVEKLENDLGSVRIALSDSEENYYDYPNPTFGVSALIQGRIARWQFAVLPFGDYAIKVFHDEDADGDLDTNFLGIPVEDYGFSNNASGLFGPPGWEAARFGFRSDTMTVWISLE